MITAVMIMMMIVKNEITMKKQNDDDSDLAVLVTLSFCNGANSIKW